MFGKILKGIAVAAGVGFAVGFGVARRRPGENRAGRSFPGKLPALAQLDRMESRIAAVEARPSPALGADSIARMNLRIEEQSKNIEALRLQMNEHRQWIANDIAEIEKRVADVTRGIPAMLESIVMTRVDDLRVRLRAETQQSLNTTLATFERAIEDKVSDRIAAIEKTLVDQSALVTGLGQRAIESDMNVQRLISAVERLCERSGMNPESRSAAAPDRGSFVAASAA